jgi:DNA-binding transcriptional LysR family regulator
MLEPLRHFVSVVEEGTFTRAARRVHLTQPALSASIRRLELELGASLLERDRRGARPTAAGSALLPHARAALAAIEDGRRAVREVAGLASGEVRVGAGTTVCAFLLPPVMASFRRRHPGVRLRLLEATTPEVLARLEGGELDLGIVTDDRAEPWYVDELVVVGAPGAAFPKTGPPTFLTLPRGTTTRELLERTFPRADVVMVLSGIEAIKSHVRAGVGMALVSTAAVTSELESGKLVRVRHPATPVPRPLGIVHRGLDRLSPSAAAMRAMLLAQRPQKARLSHTVPRRRGSGVP